MNNKLLVRIIESKDKINKIAAQISENKIEAFNEITLSTPELKYPVHGFYTCISWLYIIYSETGKITIDFLTEHAIDRNLCDESFFKKHRHLVNNFRTYLQHNLNLNSRKDFAKKEYCIGWLQSKLKTTISWPIDDKQWGTLTEYLLNDSVKFISHLLDAIDLLAKDESHQEIIQIWLSRIRRQINPYEYDEIIEQVLFDFGQSNLDIEKIRKTHFEKWNSRLKARGFRADLKKEARSLVEQTLIMDENIPLPISGKDLIDELRIQPGPIIKEILKKITAKYRQKPMNKAQLIEWAKDYLRNNC